MYKKILIPLDNSPTDTKILEHIRPLAKMTKAKLVLVHVAEGFAARLQDELNLADSEEMTGDQAYLDAVRDALARDGFSVKGVLLQGKEPVDGILAVAEQEECDLIAMSTHGHGFIKDVILGSVADTLRHRTGIPILMIRASLK
ncbi:MAG: universal stress protein [Candidatus Omnitrophica bacterium]|nr:universal stress protein [Candidatus Omnitrophota bacterium]